MKSLSLAFIRHAIGIVLLMGLAVMNVHVVRAGGTATTKPTPFKKIADLKTVTVQCTFSVKDRADKKKDLSGECTFKNTDPNQKKSFLFCMMTDLQEKLKNKITENLNGKTFRVEEIEQGGQRKLICKNVKGGTGGLAPSSYHFGCHLIELDKQGAAGGKDTFKLPFGAATPYMPLKDVTNPKASDFQVFYADVVNLTGRNVMADVNNQKELICKDDQGMEVRANGQNFALSLDQASIVQRNIGAEWVVQHAAFVDPFVVFQPISPPVPPARCDADGDGIIDLSDVRAIFAARNTSAEPNDPRDLDGDGKITVNDARGCVLKVSKEYALFDDSPCVPSGFPTTVPDLPACPLHTGAPPPLSVDLNLFFFASEAAPPGTAFPSVLSIQTEGNMAGVRVQSEPEAGAIFNIPGGEELYGDLVLCSDADTARCLSPKVEEGRRLGVIVDIKDAGSAEDLFFESGEFIHDTEPPKVTFHSVRFDSSNNLLVEVAALDAASSPIHAEFWFSADGGVTWDHTALAPTTDILQESHERTFQGIVGPFSSVGSVRYFITVQDTVFNVNYFALRDAVP